MNWNPFRNDADGMKKVHFFLFNYLLNIFAFKKFLHVSSLLFFSLFSWWALFKLFCNREAYRIHWRNGLQKKDCISHLTASTWQTSSRWMFAIRRKLAHCRLFHHIPFRYFSKQTFLPKSERFMTIKLVMWLGWLTTATSDSSSLILFSLPLKFRVLIIHFMANWLKYIVRRIACDFRSITEERAARAIRKLTLTTWRLQIILHSIGKFFEEIYRWGAQKLWVTIATANGTAF